MVSNGYKIAGIAVLACILGYFLPWVSAGALGFSISINGWQATFGYSFLDTNIGGGDFLYILVLLAPLAVAYLLYNSFRKGGALDRMMDSYVLMGIGALVLVLMLVANGGFGGLGVSLGFGWILCLLAAIGFGVGGFLNYQQLQKVA